MTRKEDAAALIRHPSTRPVNDISSDDARLQRIQVDRGDSAQETLAQNQENLARGILIQDHCNPPMSSAVAFDWDSSIGVSPRNSDVGKGDVDSRKLENSAFTSMGPSADKRKGDGDMRKGDGNVRSSDGDMRNGDGNVRNGDGNVYGSPPAPPTKGSNGLLGMPFTVPGMCLGCMRPEKHTRNKLSRMHAQHTMDSQHKQHASQSTQYAHTSSYPEQLLPAHSGTQKSFTSLYDLFLCACTLAVPMPR